MNKVNDEEDEFFMKRYIIQRNEYDELFGYWEIDNEESIEFQIIRLIEEYKIMCLTTGSKIEVITETQLKGELK